MPDILDVENREKLIEKARDYSVWLKEKEKRNKLWDNEICDFIYRVLNDIKSDLQKVFSEADFNKFNDKSFSVSKNPIKINKKVIEQKWVSAQFKNYSQKGQLIRGGCLAYLPSDNGKILVQVDYPYYENTEKHNITPSIKIDKYVPEAINENIIVDHFIKFLDEIIKWEKDEA